MRPRLVSPRGRWARACRDRRRGAALLGGDAVSIGIRVGPGRGLLVEDVGGTVAYPCRDADSRWDVDIDVAEGASLVWGDVSVRRRLGSARATLDPGALRGRRHGVPARDARARAIG
ncbi:urease accessory protein UreD [Brevibacterium casei]|nr:urease accessory protein UreD [Brevibacterium casei]